MTGRIRGHRKERDTVSTASPFVQFSNLVALIFILCGFLTYTFAYWLQLICNLKVSGCTFQGSFADICGGWELFQVELGEAWPSGFSSGEGMGRGQRQPW